MKIIGITGGIGGGKTTILNFISSHYIAEIYYADDIAKELEQPGTMTYDRLVAMFGKDILEKGEGSEIDRSKFAQVIYSNPDNLEKVEEIVHPSVQNYLIERMRAAAKMHETELFFIEAALLIEKGYSDIVDEMWYIYTDDETRINRLMESKCDPLGGVIFTDMCTDLERCSDQAINIATALYPNDSPHPVH